MPDDHSLTIGAALASAKAQLAGVSDSASLDAQVLLGEILGVGRATLFAYPERALTPEQAARYTEWIARRAQGEPVAYLLGRRAFYDRDFWVTPDVLIPRPETELLLEMALDFARSRPQAGFAAADVGTGSGALAVTFAAHQPGATVYAIDLSPAALVVARRNALHPPEGSSPVANIAFFEGDLLSPLIARGLRVDLLMANLPYIAAEVLPTLEVSRYEPLLALDGGPDGLDLVRRLLAVVGHVCRPGAVILLEIGADQGAAALGLACDALPDAAVTVARDAAGHDRVVRIALG
jgi:release factor glutamine methyltransferase